MMRQCAFAFVVGLSLARCCGSVRPLEPALCSKEHVTYKLHAGLQRAHSLINASELAAVGVSNPPLAPKVDRLPEDLFDDWSRVQTLLRDSKSHDEIYQGLLASMITKRGGTVGTYEDNRNAQIAYVKSLYDGLLCDSEQEPPQAFFVFGATAVGKSTFVKTSTKLPPGTLHINADDIRSLLVGNYLVYSKMTGDGKDPSLMRFPASSAAAQDTNKIRFYLCDKIKERKCNLLADSYSAPAIAVNGLYDAGYITNVFYLEIGLKGTTYAGQAADFEKKVEISRERIRQRIQDGGHSSSSPDLMPEGFIKDLRLKIASLALNLKVPTRFYVSQDNGYKQVDWPAVTDMEVATSADV